MGIQALTKRKQSLLKAALIPFAVISSAVVTTKTSKAFAAVKDPSQLKANAHHAREHDPSTLEQIAAMIKEYHESVAHIKVWFEELPAHIAEGSVVLMAWLYDLCSNLILKTPLWLFDNEWFENTTYLFSLLSIGLVSVLTVIEGIKRMMSGLRKSGVDGIGRPMELKSIFKRWFFVAGITTVVPYAFQKAFQGLNYVSETLISMGKKTMDAAALPETVTVIDAVALTVFDIILISTVIPVLWKNGRRFFDLMVLGVASPVALTAWIFDPYRHYFKQWWSNVKQLSLVQVYYSLFLLILGWFIFGVPTPVQFTGLIVKMLVVTGGFARMANPPRIIASKMEMGKGFGEEYGGKVTVSKLAKNFKDTATLIAHPTTVVKKAFAEPIRYEGKYRMQRMHGAGKAKPLKKEDKPKKP